MINAIPPRMFVRFRSNLYTMVTGVCAQRVWSRSRLYRLVEIFGDLPEIFEEFNLMYGQSPQKAVCVLKMAKSTMAWTAASLD